jgi:hypothetical protein
MDVSSVASKRMDVSSCPSSNPSKNQMEIETTTSC